MSLTEETVITITCDIRRCGKTEKSKIAASSGWMEFRNIGEQYVPLWFHICPTCIAKLNLR